MTSVPQVTFSAAGPDSAGVATFTTPSVTATTWPHASARVTSQSQSVQSNCTSDGCCTLVASTWACRPALRSSLANTSLSLASTDTRLRRGRVRATALSRNSTCSTEPWAPASRPWRTTRPLNSTLSCAPGPSAPS